MTTMPAIDTVRTTTCTIATDLPESDGTLEWDATTIVLVEIEAGGRAGLGFTYGDAATAQLIDGTLAAVVEGRDALRVPATWAAMRAAVRNSGQSGVAAMAISAVDIALWDLAAKLLDQPLFALLGAHRDAVPIYGSGGFCSYDDERLARQLGGWARQGIPRVKMKVGRDPAADGHRVDVARSAIGPDVALFVDANGAYDPAEAQWWAHELARRADVRWLEEPVSSENLAGLRLVRDTAPPGMAVAAGEYAYTARDFRGLLEAGAVHVLQADATRCLGITGFRQAGALAAAHGLPLSAHCAPAIHAHAGCAVERLAHLEWFHDHVRIEHLLFDGAPDPDGGAIRPDPARPGLGLELRRDAVDAYRV